MNTVKDAPTVDVIGSHKKAAEQYQEAAKAHLEAAKQHEAGNEDKANEWAKSANQFVEKAMIFDKEVANYHRMQLKLS